MCEHFHVMDAAAPPQPGYAIRYVEVYSFDVTIASQSGYFILQTHHDFTPGGKKVFLLFSIEISCDTIHSARAHSSAVRAAGS